MSFPSNISAGESFDLIRPAVLVLSALVSIWVVVSARKRFTLYLATAWALGTLVFPLIVFPLYLIARFVRKRRVPASDSEDARLDASASRSTLKWRIAAPLTYAAVILSAIGVYLYRDHQSVDAHLARAAQARVSGDRGRTIAEYRAALKNDNNPHTHKLLAIELADAGYFTEGLSEFYLAEQGGEPDSLISFRVAKLLDSLQQASRARLEYQRFLQSTVCTQALPDNRCDAARQRISALTVSSSGGK